MSPSDLRLIRLVLALIWIGTGIISLWLYPIADSLALLARVGFARPLDALVLTAAGYLDIVLGLLTLFYPRRWL